MKYADGKEARLGDRVTLGDGAEGAVVVSIDTDEYAIGHPKSQWAYLKHGIMVEFPEYGLIYYEEVEPDLRLVERKSAPARQPSS
jgi:hypothetical protein